MIRSTIIFYFFSLLCAQHINLETGWEFFSSPNQSFYIFDTIEIDGEPALGDGWAPSGSETSFCIENPFSCDVVGAFLNDVCVGWVYSNLDGFTTLPIMGSSQVADDNETADYCVEGDIPVIKIYDSSSESILDLISSDIIPSWSENEVYQIENISFANNGIIAEGPGWSYYQTSNQAFYIFENILIQDVLLDESDFIGAFKNDSCVGWINYDTEGFTSVPVMGVESNGLYPNYMLDNEIPYFRIFDYSENNYYDIVPNQELNGWLSGAYFIVSGNSLGIPLFIEGCIDDSACNYNPDANTDDGSCLYDDCLGDCGGSADFDECGVCDGDGTTCYASLSLGSFSIDGSLEILYDFGGPVAGFQFDVTGLTLEGGSGGAAGDAGMEVNVGGETVIGFSFENNEILPGSGILTILSFSSIIEGFTEIVPGVFGAITDSDLNIYNSNFSGLINHGEPDCAGVYYGDSFIDDCGGCVSYGTPPDDCLSSDLAIPDKLYLNQNYPNPFNPSTSIDYGVPFNSRIKISLYDLNGRIIRNIVDGFHVSGNYSLELNSNNLNSGVYLVKISSPKSVESIKITMIK